MIFKITSKYVDFGEIKYEATLIDELPVNAVGNKYKAIIGRADELYFDWDNLTDSYKNSIVPEIRQEIDKILIPINRNKSIKEILK